MDLLRSVTEQTGARAEVTVVLTDAVVVRGQLWLVGVDVVGMRGEDRRAAYLALGAIDHVTW